MDDTEARIRELLLLIRDTEQSLEGFRRQLRMAIRSALSRAKWPCNFLLSNRLNLRLGLVIRRPQVVRSLQSLKVSLRSTASRAGVILLIPTGRSGYHSGRCAFFMRRSLGGTVSGTDWVGAGSESRCSERVRTTAKGIGQPDKHPNQGKRYGTAPVNAHLRYSRIR